MGLLLFILRHLGARRARALLGWLACVAWALGVRRRIALDNLRRAFPQLSEAERCRIARANYRHLGECAADFLRSPYMTEDELSAMVEPGDFDKIDAMAKAGQGFVAATAHFGNFELFGVYAARRKVPLTILTRRLKGSANARWVRTRALAGIREVHKGMDNLVAAVNRGDAMALLIDQNMQAWRAVFVPFFGTLAATTPAPAVVAQRTGVPVILAFMLRQGDGRYRVHVDGPFTFVPTGDPDGGILAFTAMLNERLEEHVRAHPEQWFWLHRRWKTRPEGEADGQPNPPGLQGFRKSA